MGCPRKRLRPRSPSLLEDLAEDVHTNEQTLDHKDRLLARAVTLKVEDFKPEFTGAVLWHARVSFAIDADRVQEELVPYREDPAAYLLRAARGLHDAYLENEQVIERREIVFGFALFALGAETLLWVLTLALT